MTKTLQLDLQKRILIVELPRLADYEFINRKSKYLKVGNEEINLNISTLSKIEIVCRGDELNEEIAKEYAFSYRVNYELVFKDHEGDDYGCETALDSFISAIESKGFTWGENPMGGKPLYATGQGDKRLLEMVTEGYLKSWEEAESKTFHPDRVLIFEILNP